MKILFIILGILLILASPWFYVVIDKLMEGTYDFATFITSVYVLIFGVFSVLAGIKDD